MLIVAAVGRWGGNDNYDQWWVAESEARTHAMALKEFTRKELTARNTRKDAVFVIDNEVYDVTRFLDDHPGGHEVLLNVAGKDASEEFDDVGHSADAKDLMKKYLIGEVVAEDRVESTRKTWSVPDPNSTIETEEDGGLLSSWKFPVLVGLVATVLYSYLFG